MESWPGICFDIKSLTNGAVVQQLSDISLPQWCRVKVNRVLVIHVLPCVLLLVADRREDQTLSILAPARDITVNAGESACFECEVRGPPDVDVDWLTNGKLVQPALLNCKMHFDGKKCKLLLNSVHEDDTGVYTCKLSTVK
ncbi:hypothetical protein scyTo_0026384, partial [Scyliorhinus torazame]|nr:hypothetical protein [Scyliorhinus torazame]